MLSQRGGGANYDFVFVFCGQNWFFLAKRGGGTMAPFIHHCSVFMKHWAWKIIGKVSAWVVALAVQIRVFKLLLFLLEVWLWCKKHVSGNEADLECELCHWWPCKESVKGTLNVIETSGSCVRSAWVGVSRVGGWLGSKIAQSTRELCMTTF